MRFLILLVIVSISVWGKADWNYNVLAEKGWKVEIICKNGYLTEVFVLPNGGKFEETYCYAKSSWNGACKHPPITCK